MLIYICTYIYIYIYICTSLSLSPSFSLSHSLNNLPPTPTVLTCIIDETGLVPPGTCVTTEVVRVNQKLCLTSSARLSVYRGETFSFDAREASIGNTALRMGTCVCVCVCVYLSVCHSLTLSLTHTLTHTHTRTHTHLHHYHSTSTSTSTSRSPQTVSAPWAEARVSPHTSQCLPPDGQGGLSQHYHQCNHQHYYYYYYFY